VPSQYKVVSENHCHGREMAPLREGREPKKDRFPREKQPAPLHVNEGLCTGGWDLGLKRKEAKKISRSKRGKLTPNTPTWAFGGRKGKPPLLEV